MTPAVGVHRKATPILTVRVKHLSPPIATVVMEGWSQGRFRRERLKRRQHSWRCGYEDEFGFVAAESGDQALANRSSRPLGEHMDELVTGVAQVVVDGLEAVQNREIARPGQVSRG